MLDVIKPYMPAYLKNLLLEHDYDAERAFRERGQRREIEFISCQGIVAREKIMQQMRDILSTIQSVYEHPVDTEFTINLSENGEYVINILQCRPLQVFQDSDIDEFSGSYEAGDVLFECKGSAMGLSRSEKIDLVLYVDPVNYYNMPYKDKYRVARAIGAVNWKMRGLGKKMLLMVPGRIGTTSPELGVPTSFADISEFEAICEISDSKAGYNPELSYGSHFFQDLVESGILYNAIFENEKTVSYDPGLLEKTGIRSEIIADDCAGLEDIVYVYDMSGKDLRLINDMKNEHIICFLSRR